MHLDHGILFNLTHDRTRIAGRRGGRARSRNLRSRQHGTQVVETVVEHLAIESTREAINKLDRLCPHLVNAERRGR